MTGPVLEYQRPRASRLSRWVLFAFLWSLLAPAAGAGLLGAVSDKIDDLFDRSVLLWVFAAWVTTAPLLGVALGGACLGAALTAGADARRRDRVLAAAAVALGWGQVVALAVLLAVAWHA
jgi:hypothetical protein